MGLNNPQTFILQSKLVTITRAAAAVSGDVAYTGIGFSPRAIIAFSTCERGALSAAVGTPQPLGQVSLGFADITLGEKSLAFNELSDGAVRPQNYLVFITDTSGGLNGQLAVLKTLDVDGFTLTWNKVGAGSPNDTTVQVLCLA